MIALPDLKLTIKSSFCYLSLDARGPSDLPNRSISLPQICNSGDNSLASHSARCHPTLDVAHFFRDCRVPHVALVRNHRVVLSLDSSHFSLFSRRFRSLKTALITISRGLEKLTNPTVGIELKTSAQL